MLSFYDRASGFRQVRLNEMITDFSKLEKNRVPRPVGKVRTLLG
jgi:hypothetical protein